MLYERLPNVKRVHYISIFVWLNCVRNLCIMTEVNLVNSKVSITTRIFPKVQRDGHRGHRLARSGTV